jgi:hypothetical protein
MEGLLGDLLAKQMVEAHHRAGTYALIPPPPQSALTGAPKEQGLGPSYSSIHNPSWIVPISIGVGTLLFFMALVIASIFGYEVPAAAKWLASVVIAFGGSLSVGLFGGKAGARGSIQIPGSGQNSFRFYAVGAIASFLILLVLARIVL